MSKETNEELQNQWHSDRRNWRLGIFYTNPKDKRLLVPKRWGWGFTFNFANPWAAILLLIIIIVPILVAILFS